DYVKLYEIVKEQMEQPSRLIETVAERIISPVLVQLPAVMQVELTIAKLNPPIGGACARASISIVRERKPVTRHESDGQFKPYLYSRTAGERRAGKKKPRPSAPS